jgi:hypothetical protein
MIVIYNFRKFIIASLLVSGNEESISHLFLLDNCEHCNFDKLKHSS